MRGGRENIQTVKKHLRRPGKPIWGWHWRMGRGMIRSGINVNATGGAVRRSSERILVMQYTSLPDGFTIQELDASHLEQFNALLRYAFQVTEEELVQVGWQEDEIKQSKFPILGISPCTGLLRGQNAGRADRRISHAGKCGRRAAGYRVRHRRGHLSGIRGHRPEEHAHPPGAHRYARARTEHLVPVPVLHPPFYRHKGWRSCRTK